MKKMSLERIRVRSFTTALDLGPSGTQQVKGGYSNWNTDCHCGTAAHACATTEPDGCLQSIGFTCDTEARCGQ